MVYDHCYSEPQITACTDYFLLSLIVQITPKALLSRQLPLTWRAGCTAHSLNLAPDLVWQSTSSFQSSSDFA
jgi:hypothetical protein